MDWKRMMQATFGGNNYAKTRVSMADETYKPENLSIETLQSDFNAAMFDASIQSETDLLVRDSYNIVVSICKRQDLYIVFRTLFALPPGMREEVLHAVCNQINDKLIIIRCATLGTEGLVFDWYLPVSGGISKRTVFRAFRRFQELLADVFNQVAPVIQLESSLQGSSD